MNDIFNTIASFFTDANVLNVVLTIATLFVGALTTYFKTNASLKEKTNQFITDAENEYIDTIHAGKFKFEMVVSKLYSIVPVYLKPIITRDMIANIVQNSFNSIESYAKTQLDKFVDKNITHEDGR